MPLTNVSVEASIFPPVNASYHFNEVPVATKLDTLAPIQNVCAAAVGAKVLFTVTNIGVRALSQALKVCEA